MRMKMELKGRRIDASGKGFEGDEKAGIVLLLNSAAGICTEGAQELQKAEVRLQK
jgi:hypothetical protein